MSEYRYTNKVWGINMLNYLWGLMVVIGIIVGTFTGKMSDVGVATINSAKEAITLCIAMFGIMAFWTGIMQIAKKSGLMEAMTKALKPMIKVLFPDLPKDHIVREYIAANMIANILGLGWAATPMGLKAMEELRKLNQDRPEASCDMCTFLIINISSLQLIPVNIIAYRSQYGSVNPAEILGTAIITTIISTIVGAVFAIVARKISRRRLS